MDADRYSFKIEATGFDEFRRQMDQSAQAVRAHDNAITQAGTGTRNFGQVVGQAGFQLQDFAVQVQAGTSALTALSQQGSQFLGAFGTGGAIAGAVLSVGLLAAGFLRAGDATEQARRETDAYKTSVASLAEMLETAAQRAERLRRATISGIVQSQQLAAESATRDMEAIGQRILTLETNLREAETRRSSLPQSAQEGLVARALDRNIEDLRKQIESLRGDSAIATQALREAQRIQAEARNAPAVGDARDLQSGFDDFFDRAENPEDRIRIVRGRSGGGSRTPARSEGERAFLRAANQNLADLKSEDQFAARSQRALDDFQKRSEDAFTAIGVNALDRIGTGLVNAFTQGGKAALDFGSLAKGILASVITDIAKLAVVNPIVNSLFGTTRPTLGGAIGDGSSSGGGILGSFGSLGSIGNLFGGSGGGGLSGMFAGVGSILSAPLWASSAGAMASAALPAGMAGPVLSGAALGSAGMGASLGGLLGGAGLGFGAGSLVGGLVAGNSAARRQNSQIGSAGGALAGAAIGSIIPGVGTVIGGLIGGALGGGAGGLFGPKSAFSGGDVFVGVDANGQLTVTGAAGKRWDAAGSTQQVQQQVAAYNQQLAAAGIRINTGPGGSLNAPIGFGQSGNPGDLSSALARSQLSFTSSNANVATALGTLGNTSVDAALSTANWVTGVYEALQKAAQPASVFAQQLSTITDRFGPAITRARELGLATVDLENAQATQIAKLTATRDSQVRGLVNPIRARGMRLSGDSAGADLLTFDTNAAAEVDSLRQALEDLGLTAAAVAKEVSALQDVQARERQAVAAQTAAAQTAAASGARGLLEQLAFGSGSSLSPEARGFAALSSLNAAKAGIGSGAGLSEYARVAASALPVIRDVFGTSQRYGAIVADVAGTLRGAAPGSDPANLAAILDAQANAGDRMTEAILSVGGNTNDLLTRILAEFSVMRGNLEALARRSAA